MGDAGLMVQALGVLAAAVVCVPIFVRLGLGSVLGYLAAGCVVGPWGARLVNDYESILHFAELGVVLMLFTIGLELEPKRLWAMRRAVFVGGSLQVGLCTAVLFGGAFAIGLPWQAALVAGLALSLSSTAIAVQTMNERNMASTPVGRSTFGVLLFQDLAAIPMLGIVPMLGAGGERSSGGWIGMATVLGAMVVVVLLGRFVVPRMMRTVARTGLREAFTALALLLVLGVGQIMSVAGASMALGAFLGGVVLATSQYRHVLESDVEPFKGLLMGLFFVAVGMSVDFGLIVREPVTVAILVVGFQLLKGGALMALGRLLAIDGRERRLFAALLAQGGEFAFVVFGVAGRAEVLPERWEGPLTLAVALSMALTPVLLLLHDRATARHAGAHAREYDRIDDDHPEVIIAGFGRYGQIVGRLLLASGGRATVLDHDPDHIETMRKFGFRVFYGDATRLDLLHAAGAARAKILVDAIDDADTSLALVDLVREHFPHLKIVARARDVVHYFALRSRGVDRVERETFESALRSGRSTLEALGMSPYEVRQLADKFRRHNHGALEAIFPHRHDEAMRITLAKQANAELERQFELDRTNLHHEGRGWHPEDDVRT